MDYKAPNAVQFLTIKEVAELLRVRHEKAVMLIHWGIGCYRIGNRVLVSCEDLRRFLSNTGYLEKFESVLATKEIKG